MMMMMMMMEAGLIDEGEMQHPSFQQRRENKKQQKYEKLISMVES